jgi:C4-dicarboxylate transporter DctQ subunit
MIKHVSTAFDRILYGLFWIAVILLIFTTVGTCVDVIGRYIFNSPIPWMLEVTEYIMLYIPFLGAAFVMKDDAHIKVDVITLRFAPRNRDLLASVTSAIGGIVMGIYTWVGFQVALDFFQRRVASLEYLKMPVYLILMIIPIGSFFFTIQFFRLCVSYLQKYKRQR